MGKFRKSTIIGRNSRPLSPDEREEKINYYRGLFWLSFRIFDEDEFTPEDEDAYDQIDCYSSVDESDVKFFEDRFTALQAADVFYKLYYDYCVDQLAVLKKQIAKYAVADLETEYVKKDAKKKYVTRMLKIQTERIAANHQAQQDYEAKIDMLKNKLIALGVVALAENDVVKKSIKKSHKKKKSQVSIKPKKEKLDSIDKILGIDKL